ncbi:hypothetical protein RVN83_00030 [Streptomyces sp. PU10]|uniref:hypothetical protein n=1 Tax=unclassified Streptomyces TaxID=2593676 RepID=UPI00106E6378|nr:MULTISPECIES: hypothetical protein [unclassified Streptomyces]MDU0251735.1 hypothetical protein [Streptomyces sp. PU10]
MFNEPTGTGRSASTLHHQRNGTLHRIGSRLRDRVKRLLDGGRRRRLRSLARTVGYGIVRGAADALGASATGWIIWWIQQR